MFIDNGKSANTKRCVRLWKVARRHLSIATVFRCCVAHNIFLGKIVQDNRPRGVCVLSCVLYSCGIVENPQTHYFFYVMDCSHNLIVKICYSYVSVWEFLKVQLKTPKNASSLAYPIRRAVCEGRRVFVGCGEKMGTHETFPVLVRNRRPGRERACWTLSRGII